MSKKIHVSGKRKRSIARATIGQGTGVVMVNKVMIQSCEPRLFRDKILEPIILSGDLASKVNINVNTMGGGIMGQADAARLAVAKSLVQFSKDKKLERLYLDYDRNLLVADVRRKEACKPNDSKARAKRQKSYR